MWHSLGSQGYVLNEFLSQNTFCSTLNTLTLLLTEDGHFEKKWCVSNVFDCAAIGCLPAMSINTALQKLVALAGRLLLYNHDSQPFVSFIKYANNNHLTDSTGTVQTNLFFVDIILQ